jgi:hypothetical protein
MKFPRTPRINQDSNTRTIISNTGIITTTAIEEVIIPIEEIPIAVVEAEVEEEAVKDFTKIETSRQGLLS